MAQTTDYSTFSAFHSLEPAIAGLHTLGLVSFLEKGGVFTTSLNIVPAPTVLQQLCPYCVQQRLSAAFQSGGM